MPPQLQRRFVHLRHPSAAVEADQAILAVKSVEKSLQHFHEKLQQAEDFLKNHTDISPPQRKNLETALKKGKLDLIAYQNKVDDVKTRLIAILR